MAPRSEATLSEAGMGMMGLWSKTPQTLCKPDSCSSGENPAWPRDRYEPCTSQKHLCPPHPSFWVGGGLLYLVLVVSGGPTSGCSASGVFGDGVHRSSRGDHTFHCGPEGPDHRDRFRGSRAVSGLEAEHPGHMQGKQVPPPPDCIPPAPPMDQSAETIAEVPASAVVVH